MEFLNNFIMLYFSFYMSSCILCITSIILNKTNYLISTRLEHWNSSHTLKWFPLENLQARRFFCSPSQRTPMWLNLLETGGKHSLLHSKGYVMLGTTQGSLPHGLQHHIPYLFSFWITSHLRAQNDDRDDKSQLCETHRPIPFKVEKNIPVIYIYIFKWVWGERMRAQENHFISAGN